jgi:hypothetical protein
MSTTNKTVTGARKAVRNELWVGIIPDIFGYGFSVAGQTAGECKKAMQQEYKRWKKMYPDTETNFESSFENFGGRIQRISLGKVYYENFGE